MCVVKLVNVFSQFACVRVICIMFSKCMCCQNGCLCFTCVLSMCSVTLQSVELLVTIVSPVTVRHTNVKLIIYHIISYIIVLIMGCVLQISRSFSLQVLVPLVIQNKNVVICLMFLSCQR